MGVLGIQNIHIMWQIKFVFHWNISPLSAFPMSFLNVTFYDVTCLIANYSTYWNTHWLPELHDRAPVTLANSDIYATTYLSTNILAINNSNGIFYFDNKCHSNVFGHAYCQISCIETNFSVTRHDISSNKVIIFVIMNS